MHQSVSHTPHVMAMTTTRVTHCALILVALGIRLAISSVIITDDTIILPGIIITDGTVVLPGIVINDMQVWQVLWGNSLTGPMPKYHN